MVKVLLFDIDGTLILTGGAGIRALNLAFFDLFGVQTAFDNVHFAGRTDSSLFVEAAGRHGINLNGTLPAMLEQFKERYHNRLQESLPIAAEEGNGRVLAGVAEFLSALHGKENFVVGLATGNFRKGAALKLGYYGIGHFFEDGGFGDDSPKREELVAIAIDRLPPGLPAGEKQVYVIGDTPKDVHAAKENGAFAIGVSTGSYSPAELWACGADVVMPSLTEWPLLLQWIGGERLDIAG